MRVVVFAAVALALGACAREVKPVVDTASADIRCGFDRRALVINALLQKRAVSLDGAYNFRPLMSDGRLPATVSEVQDSDVLEGDQKITSSSRKYQIVRGSRYVIEPPTWRNYLLLPAPAPSTQKSGCKVKDANLEMMGTNQANAVFDASLAELTRDFRGMMFAHRLLRDRILSDAEIERVGAPIIVTDTTVTFDSRERQITSPARFEPVEKWSPFVGETK